MSTIPTRTQVWPICHVGSYDGDVLDPDYVMGVEHEQEILDEEGDGCRIVSWEFDSESWDEAVVKAAQDAFDRNEPLKGRGVKRVVVKKYWHPREYNFITDDLYVDVEVDDVNEFVRNAKDAVLAKENREKVEKYVLDHWHSRDGFFSHMSETYDELADDFDTFLSDGEDTNFHCYGVELFLGEVLTLLSLIDGEIGDDERDEESLYGCGGITDDIVEYLSQNHSATEFYLVYKPEEVLKMNELKEPDWDAEIALLEDACAKYRACFEDGSEQDVKCREWLEKAHDRIRVLKEAFADRLDNAVGAHRDEKTGECDYSRAVLEHRDWVEETIKGINDEFANGLKIRNDNDSND